MINLLLFDLKEPIYINEKHILSLFKTENKGTGVVLSNNLTYYVAEKSQEILNIIHIEEIVNQKRILNT